MRVSNALSDDMDTLRTSLVPSLVGVVALNRDRGRADVRVYEIASAFLAPVGDKTEQPEEPIRLAAVATSGADADAGRQAFYAMKSVLDACLVALGAPACTYQRAAAELFHPGRCAAVVMEGRQLGYIGELHPSVVAVAKMEGRLVAMEIDLEPLLAASRIPRAQPLPRFPSVERDLAVLVEDHVAAAALAGHHQGGRRRVPGARARVRRISRPPGSGRAQEHRVHLDFPQPRAHPDGR